MEENEENEKLHVSPSDDGLTIQMRDQINDQLQDSFDVLLDYKNQAIKQTKIAEEQKLVIEKLKSKADKLRNELKEKRTNMNTILNLFNVEDQISIEKLKEIIENWRKKDELYSSIAKTFRKNPEENIDFSNSILEMMNLINELENLLNNHGEGIVSAVKEILENNGQLENLKKDLSNTLSVKPENIKNSIDSIMNENSALNEENKKKNAEILNLKKEIKQLSSLKKAVSEHLGVNNDSSIIYSIDKLRNDSNILQKINEKINCDEGSTEVTVHSLISKLQQLENERSVISKTLGVPITTLVTSVNDLNETKKRLEAEINDLKKENEKMKGSILKFESQGRSNKDAIRERDISIENITKERDQLKEKSRKQEEKIVSLNRAKEELSAQLTTTKSQLQQNESLKKMLQSEFDTSKQQSNTVVEKLVADNTQKASEINKLKVEISAAKLAQNTLQEKIHNLEEQQKVENEAADKIKDANSKLQSELYEKQDENGKLKANIDSLSKEKAEMQAKLQQSLHAYSLLQSEHDTNVNTSEEALAKAAKDLSEKVKEITAIKSELAEAKRMQLSTETTKQQIESELAANKQHSSEVINKLKDDINAKTEEIAKVNAELLSAKSAVENLQRQFKQMEASQQITQSQYEAEKSNTAEKTKKLVANNAEKQKEITSLKATISDLEREKAEAIVKMNTLQANIEQNTSIQQMMQGEYEASKKHANELLDKVTNESTEKSKEIANLKLELATIGTKHEAESSQIIELNTKLEQMEQQKESISNELEEAKLRSEKSLTDLTTESQSKCKEIASLKEKISAQEVEISQLTTTVQNMKLEMETLNSKLDHKEAFINQQKQELSSQKEQISTLLNQMTEDKQNNIKEIQALKKEIAFKEQNISQLNDEISSLNDSSQSIVNGQASDLQKLTAKGAELSEQIKKVTLELHQANEQNNNLISEGKKKDSQISSQQKIIERQNAFINDNSKEVAALQQQIGKAEIAHEEEIAALKKECAAQISDLKKQQIQELAKLTQEKHDEITKAQENSQDEMTKLSSSTQQKLEVFVAQSKKVLADKQNEIIELTNKFQNEISDMQKKNQDELTQLINEKQKEEIDFAEKENKLNHQVSNLEIENSQLRAKIDAIGKQITETSKELNEVQNDFVTRSRAYDQSVSMHKEALAKICDALGMKKSSTPTEMISFVEKLMKNFAKQQTEVCKSLNIPKGSPAKVIKKRINDLSDQSTTICTIADHLGVQPTPEAINDRVDGLEKLVDLLQNKLKKKERELREIACKLNVTKVSDVNNKLQSLIDENEQLQADIENSQLFKGSLCQTLGCDENELDKTVEDVFSDKKALQRAQQKLAELVGVDEESLDCASVVYEKVQDLKNTHDELSTILGTQRVGESVASLKRQNDELLSVFEGKDDDESIVYAAASTKRSLQNLEEEKEKMLTQQTQLCDIMNVSSFKDLQRSVISLKKDNERLKSREIENSILREQVADVIDEGGLDSSRNDTIIQALQQLKEEKQNLSESLSDQTKLISAALGIKGRTSEAMAKGIISLKKKCKANEDTVKRMQDMMFGICRMLNIEFTTEKTTFGEIELAIGSILSSNSILRDRIGEIVGLSPSMREPKAIAQEVKKLFNTAKDVEKMRKVVGELEASKQEMQRLVYRPKTTVTIQTDPVENESLPIIQNQAATIRDIESRLRQQEQEIGHSVEEIDILRSSLDDIYRSLGTHVATPREAIREIGHLKMQNDDLSRSVLEAKGVPISSSALSDFQQAQIANLRATSDRLYNQAKTIKTEVTSGMTTPVASPYSSRSRTPRTPSQTSPYRERNQPSTPTSIHGAQSPAKRSKYL